MAKLRVHGSRVVMTDTRAVRPAPKSVNPLYTSSEWRALIGLLITTRGRRCQVCGRARNADGSSIRVFGDHIKELRDGGALLDPANVELKCGACHTTKTVRERGRRRFEEALPDPQGAPKG